MRRPSQRERKRICAAAAAANQINNSGTISRGAVFCSATQQQSNGRTISCANASDKSNEGSDNNSKNSARYQPPCQKRNQDSWSSCFQWFFLLICCSFFLNKEQVTACVFLPMASSRRNDERVWSKLSPFSVYSDKRLRTVPSCV